MKIRALTVGAFAVLLVAAALFAQQPQLQSQQPQPNSTASQQAGSSTPRPKVPRPQNEQGCWRKAGIPDAVMQKRKDIQANAKPQIDAIYKNSSLTKQQKREQVRKVHLATQEQVLTLLNQQQQDALAKCQRARGKGGARASNATNGPRGTTE